MRRRGALLLAAAAWVTAACGTTVPTAGTPGAAGGEALPAGQSPTEADAALGGAAGSGPQIAAGSGDAGPPGAAGPDAGPLGGTAGAARPGSSVGGANAGSGAMRDVTAGKPVAAHPGVTGTKLFIGLSRDRSQDPAVGLGASIPRPPTDQIKAALVDYYNQRGGLAGRQLVPVHHDYKTTSKTYAQTQQEACARFTEDSPVFAALNAGTYGLQTEDATYQDCMGRRSVTTIASAGTRGDDATYRRIPSMIDVSGLNYTRMARVYVDTLVGRGFLTNKTKIGLLYVERSDTARAIKQTLEPGLAGHGLKLEAKFGFRQHQSDGEAGATVSDVSSAVLKFQSAGVDRVLFLESTGGAVALIFMQQAESQNYRPRYAFTSTQAAQVLQSTYPAEQQRGAVGVGWLPMVDVSPVGRAPRTAAADQCNAIIKAAGIRPPTNEVEEVQRLGLCEPFFFLAAAVRQLVADGSPLSTAALMGALDRLGTSYSSTVEWYGTRFGPFPRDGAAAVRYFSYVDSCTCYRSSGGVVSVP